MQDYFCSVLRYAYHNDSSANFDNLTKTKAIALFKSAKELSKERGYSVFNVKSKKGMTGTEEVGKLSKLVTTIFHCDILKEVFANANKT